MATRTPFTLHESARVRNGAIVAVHGPNCASRSGGECACAPTYRLQRTPSDRRVR